jgi:hypothetical protein
VCEGERERLSNGKGWVGWIGMEWNERIKKVEVGSNKTRWL